MLAVDLEPAGDVRGEPFAADLTTGAGNRGAVDAALERLGVVVLNAGFRRVAPVAGFVVDRWDALLAILVTSSFLLARYGWSALRGSGDGRVVVVACVHGLVASPFRAGCVSAKHGVIGVVKALALEGADGGITAMAVCPGFVGTPVVERQIGDQARGHGVPEQRVLEDVVLRPHAVKRLIEPAEVAGVVSFLLGRDGRAFTGAPVTMGLGWTAR